MRCSPLFSFFFQALFEPVAIPGTADDMGLVGQSVQQSSHEILYAFCFPLSAAKSLRQSAQGLRPTLDFTSK